MTHSKIYFYRSTNKEKKNERKKKTTEIRTQLSESVQRLLVWRFFVFLIYFLPNRLTERNEEQTKVSPFVNRKCIRAENLELDFSLADDDLFCWPRIYEIV